MSSSLCEPSLNCLQALTANNAAKGQADIIIAKHRNGETGTIGFGFKGKYCKFIERDLRF
jgi:replicative DNA helicase